MRRQRKVVISTVFCFAFINMPKKCSKDNKTVGIFLFGQYFDNRITSKFDMFLMLRHLRDAFPVTKILYFAQTEDKLC